MRNRFPEVEDISPKEFEEQVGSWLRGTSQKLCKFNIIDLKKIEGAGGEYEIDAVAEFEILGGAIITVLVECKYYKSPVKRDVVMILDAKIRDTGAHKGIVFSTSGFQSGALQYAKVHGIATVHVVDGSALYETKGLFDRPMSPPPWVTVFKYAGYSLTYISEGSYSSHLVSDDYSDAINEWLISDSTNPT